MLNISKKIRYLTSALLVTALLLPSLTSHAVPSKPHFSTPMEFARAVYPYAVSAAKKLGCDPKVLVAQAAHETNWGKSIPKHQDGSSSHNLFGMKSFSKNAKDKKVKASTKEYVNGKPVKDVAHFRAYEGYDESFVDYANTILRAKRYENAIANADDAQLYLQELQNAGYATDPRYAKKIYDIYRLTLKSL
jgi:peptidoglycan hydrolase FlgJ